MMPDTVFSTANTVAAASWLMLIAAGRTPRVASTIAGAVIPLLLSCVYAALLITHWGGAEGGFGSVSEVRMLFANDWLLTAGWVHYLAFDLFIGAWEVRDAQRHEIRHVFIIPALILTFLFGPAGLLVYYATRFIGSRQTAIQPGQ